MRQLGKIRAECVKDEAVREGLPEAGRAEPETGHNERGIKMGRIFCIIDGMTDSQFQVNDYPNLSKMRLTQYADTSQGHEAESLRCILWLLGVREIPEKLRGYAEALGAGIPVGEDDLILRGSWFALDGDGRCTIPVPGPAELAVPSAECQYYLMDSYKSLLVLPGMADLVGDVVTYPPCNGAGRKAEEMCPCGSGVLQRIFVENMGEGRCLIPWGQSVPVKLPPFPEKAATVCGTTIVRGIARLLGMELIAVEGATGDVDTDLEAKLSAALSAAEQYPFVMLHINGADEAAHRKDRTEKKAFLQKVDKTVVAELLNSRHEVMVVSDHGTDPETGLHAAGRQPVFISAR